MSDNFTVVHEGKFEEILKSHYFLSRSIEMNADYSDSVKEHIMNLRPYMHINRIRDTVETAEMIYGLKK